MPEDVHGQPLLKGGFIRQSIYQRLHAVRADLEAIRRDAHHLAATYPEFGPQLMQMVMDVNPNSPLPKQRVSPMPEDVNGQPLLEGDRVLVPCRVVEVLPGPDHCNVTVEVELPCYPGAHRTRVWLNGRQCERRAETVQTPAQE